MEAAGVGGEAGRGRGRAGWVQWRVREGRREKVKKGGGREKQGRV